MVAPTRTPQVRGVKCQLCSKILTHATWIDQTKLSKSVGDAQTVLDLISKHSKQGCLCMPKNIENLLIGSTHFEIHRLLSKSLDTIVHNEQVEYFQEQLKRQHTKTVIINDCIDHHKTSRFKLLPLMKNENFHKDAKLHIKHLCLAIDYWKVAVEDLISVFNSKLALRLGLTHHAIYACYLFKYHRMFKYQLISSDLVLNLFKLIDGVTDNAQMHAHYLMIKTLIDCEQYTIARQYLKQSTRIANFQDKSHYESILLTCVSSELNLIDETEPCNMLNELASLTNFHPNDKLQHYYARTLALSTLIKYLQHFEKCNEFCVEFYKTFRYLSAIIRRCFESSFELIFLDKDSKTVKQQNGSSSDQILQHGWIKYAACDFVFSSFDLLIDFYLRTGQPESVELLYNGLNLICYRTTSYFWQVRMLSLGAKLDSISNKYDHVRMKHDAMTQILYHAEDSQLMTMMMRLDLEVSTLCQLIHEDKIEEETVLDILNRLKNCRLLVLKKIEEVELYDCKSNNFIRLNPTVESSLILVKGYLGNLSLQVLKAGFMMASLKGLQYQELSNKLALVLEKIDNLSLEHHIYESFLEIILIKLEICRSEEKLLESINGSRLFLDNLNPVDCLDTQLSKLSLNSTTRKTSQQTPRPIKTRSKLTTLRKSRRKGTYKVAEVAQKNLNNLDSVAQVNNRSRSLKDLLFLSDEEKLLAYLRLSGSSPDYLLYRRANEMLLSIYIQQEEANHPHEKLLYHFVESATSNTFRYRWMMFNEALDTPGQNLNNNATANSISDHRSTCKQLSFISDIDRSEKEVKGFLKVIPTGYRIVQFKFMVDHVSQCQHLVAACFERDSNNLFFVNCRKTIIPDSFMNEPMKEGGKDQLMKFTLPSQLESKLEKAKATLFLTSQSSRTEARRRIEADLGLILYDFENDWLGPYRFILCGGIQDIRFGEMTGKVCEKIQQIFSKTSSCRYPKALSLLINNGGSLERSEFRLVLSKLFDCPITSNQVEESHNFWLNAMKTYISENAPNLDKNSLVASFKRNQIGLILDKTLESLPIESFPLMRLTNQGIFRVPSLRLLSVMRSDENTKIIRQMPSADPAQCAYILDPAGNLARTREKFERKLTSQEDWSGVINKPPEPSQLEEWLSTRQIYMFIGHGAGVIYYNRLCKGRGLSAVPLVKASSIVMGCSSGRMTAEGPQLESFGIGWVFVMKSCASYVGLLWDVTDTDIDKFLDKLLELWLPKRWNNSSNSPSTILLTDAVSRARHICQYTFLVGSTPVLYGLPVSSSNKPLEDVSPNSSNKR